MSIPQQAGIYQITLYERKGLSLTYSDGTTLSGVSNTGQIVSLTHGEYIKWNYENQGGKNANLLFKHTIKFWYDGLTESMKANIKTLIDSVYGWTPLIEMNNGEKYFINDLFAIQNTDMDSSKSHTWPIELKSPILSRNHVYLYLP